MSLPTRRHGHTLRFSCTLAIISTSVQNALGKVNVTWSSPSNGDVYGPGDTIIGKWESPKPVVSPSFRLCVSSESVNGTSYALDGESAENCGSTIWPTVQQRAGYHYVSVAVPNITSEGNFSLQMEDDFGETELSPMFFLNPLSPASPSSTSAENDPAENDPATPATMPFGLPHVTPSGNSTSEPSPTATVTPVAATNGRLATTRNPAPVAAFAVPVSLLSSILLAGVGMSLYHRRKLKNERACDAKKLELSRQSSFATLHSTSTRSADVEKMLQVLSSTRNELSYGSVPALVGNLQEPRLATRQPYPTRYPLSGEHAAKTVPASVFRATAHSPRPTHACSPQLSSRARNIDNDESNAAITESVISRYLHPSPQPPSSNLTVPPQLHTRSEAVSTCYDEKPLPPSPDDPHPQRLYEVVAGAIGRRLTPE